MTKNKTLAIIATSILSLPISASALYCPFTDYFALSIAPGGRIIGNVKVDGNLKYQQDSNTFFMLSCANDKKVTSGDVTMKIGFDDTNSCTIVLHDGPYVVNPSVTMVACGGGVNFNGIDHFTGSHNYTLRFSI